MVDAAKEEVCGMEYSDMKSRSDITPASKAAWQMVLPIMYQKYYEKSVFPEFRNLGFQKMKQSMCMYILSILSANFFDETPMYEMT